MKIGVFDSGVGGLTVLRAIHKLLPQHDLVYFGDSIHLPYGSKSKKNILNYSIDSCKFLLSKKADLLVIACNTASAIAEKNLKKKFDLPITGVIIPGVEESIKISTNNRICIAGTFRTTDSHVYKNEILIREPKAEVIEVPCPSLVSLIEEGLKDPQIFNVLINYYLSSAIINSDTLVLGCTHYPLIKEIFKKNFPKINLVDSAVVTAKKVGFMIKLTSHSKIHSRIINRVGSVNIYTNDINEVFTNLSKKMFPHVRVESI